MSESKFNFSFFGWVLSVMSGQGMIFSMLSFSGFKLVCYFFMFIGMALIGFGLILKSNEI